MKCPQCGLENRDTAQFCLGCGRRLQGGDTDAARAVKQPKPRKVIRRKKSAGPQTIQKGRYLVIQKLGSGGMSRVYLARDTKMDCNVVIKEMFPPKTYPEKKAYFLKKFKNEAKLLYRLRHSGIPRVTDYFAEADNYYMVMEYIEGENIDAILKNRPNHQISAEEFFDWMNKILDIIRFLHNQKPPIFHRDIKPANFMLDNRGNVFLVDFGVAKVIAMEEAHTRIGTIGYASPEHFTGKFIKSSDLFSLGASFHFLLSGDDPRYRLPFDFPPLSVYRKDLPEGVVEIVGKMLEKEPKNRFPSVEHLKKDFVAVEKEIKGSTGQSEPSSGSLEKPAAAAPPPVARKPAPEVASTPVMKKPVRVSEEVRTHDEAGAGDSDRTVKRASEKLDLPILKKSRRTSRQMIRKIARSDSQRAKVDPASAPSPSITVRPVIPKPSIERVAAIKKPPPMEIKRTATSQTEGIATSSADSSPVSPDLSNTENIAKTKKTKYENIREKLAASKRESQPPTLIDRSSEPLKPSILKRAVRSPVTGKPLTARKPNLSDDSDSESEGSEDSGIDRPLRGVKKHELPPRPGDQRPKKPDAKKTDSETSAAGMDSKASEPLDVFPELNEKRFSKGESVYQSSGDSNEFDQETVKQKRTPRRPSRGERKSPVGTILMVILGILLVGGIIFFFTKFGKGAIKIDDVPKISEEDQSKAKEFFDLGEKAFKDKNYNKSIMLLNKAIKLNADVDPYAYYYRGLSYRIKQDYFRSIEDLEHFKRNDSSLNVDNELADNYFKRSNSAFNKSNYSEAISDMEESINLMDGLNKVKVEEMKEQIARKNTSRVGEIRSEMSELKDRISKTNEFLSDAYYKRGMESLKNKEYDTAISDFKLAIKKDEKNTEASMGIVKTSLERGKELQKEGKTQEALDAFAGALSGNMDSAETLKLIREDDEIRKTLSKYLIEQSTELKKKGELEGALKNIEIAQKLTPENTEINTYLSRILTNLGDTNISKENFKEAEKHLTRAISLNPDNKLAMTRRALCKLNMKSYDEAIKECSKVLKMDKTFTDAYLVRGTAYFYKNDYKNARNDLEKVKVLDPGSKNAQTAQNILNGFPK